MSSPENIQNQSNEKFNLDLMKNLPKETQERLSTNWNIPEGMDTERKHKQADLT